MREAGVDPNRVPDPAPTSIYLGTFEFRIDSNVRKNPVKICRSTACVGHAWFEWCMPACMEYNTDLLTSTCWSLEESKE